MGALIFLSVLFVALSDLRVALRLGAVSAAIVVVVALALAAKVRTFSPVLDDACGALAIVAYPAAVVAAWRSRPRALGVVAGMIAVTPIVALVHRFGMAAALALMIIGSFDVPSMPEHSESVSSTLECRVFGWGMAFTDEGYTVYVYRHPPFVPLMREVASVTVDQSAGTEPRSATCASVAAQFRNR